MMKNKSIPAKPGDIITFGDYDWRVLDIKDNKALIITESIVEQRADNKVVAPVTWETCTLRKYLNSEFLGKLDNSRIALTTNQNPDNPWFGTSGGNVTQDRIFLLSLDEVCCYFGDSTEKLRNKGFQTYRIDDENNQNRVAKNSKGTALRWWWFRSPGGRSNFADSVDYDGLVRVDGFIVSDISGGIRPALWLNL